MRTRTRALVPFVTTLLAFVSSSLPSFAGVIVVDASGGGQFTNLPPAVAAAQDGDTILVKAGSYAAFTIDDKSLSVVADSGAAVTIAGTVRVSNLAAARTVVLSGLSSSGPRGLYLLNNVGAVRAQACFFRGADGTGAGPGAESVNSGSVAFVDCILRGGDVGECFYCESIPGGPGIQATSSKIALYDCHVRGGDGSYGQDYQGGNGGIGAYIYGASSFVHCSGTAIGGGDGGWACDWGGPVPGGGGDGVYLSTPSSAWLVESAVVPGEPGYEYPSGGCFGAPVQGPRGSAFAGPGTHYDLATAKLEMEPPPTVRESTALVLTIRGAPGDQVFLSMSDSTTFVGIPSFHGVRVTRREGPLHSARILGPIPASGWLVETLYVPELSPGVQAKTSFLQAWSRGPSTGRTLGSFAALTVLDSTF